MTLRAGDTVLDAVSYPDDFGEAGVAWGVDPAAADAEANDDPGRWCPQTGTVPGGADLGSPGRENPSCGR